MLASNGGVGRTGLSTGPNATAPGRGPAAVRAAMAAKDDAIQAAVNKAAAGGRNKDAVLRQIEQRCIFAGVYGKDTPLDAVVPNILSELSEAQRRPSKQGAFALRNGVYDDRHAAIRKEASSATTASF